MELRGTISRPSEGRFYENGRRLKKSDNQFLNAFQAVKSEILIGMIGGRFAFSCSTSSSDVGVPDSIEDPLEEDDEEAI